MILGLFIGWPSENWLTESIKVQSGLDIWILKTKRHSKSERSKKSVIDRFGSQMFRAIALSSNYHANVHTHTQLDLFVNVFVNKLATKAFHTYVNPIFNSSDFVS